MQNSTNPQQPHFIGIDVSQDRLDVTLLPGQKRLSIPNQDKDIQAFIQEIRAFPIELNVREATGGLETLAVSLLASQGLPVVVVNPRQVRDFAKATGKLAKTDRIDADSLAHFAQVLRPEIRSLKDEQQRELGGFLT